MFEAPIPGESLTREPKNAPFERPPELSDPEDALLFHVEKLTDEKRLAGIFTLLEGGMSIRQLTEGFVRAGVYKGMHSVDVSMIIAPAIHEYIKTSADMLGIEYVEGFETEEDTEKARYTLSQVKARKALAKIGADPKEAVEGLSMEFTDTVPAMNQVVQEVKPSGLMARRDAQ